MVKIYKCITQISRNKVYKFNFGILIIYHLYLEFLAIFLSLLNFFFENQYLNKQIL